MCKVQSFYDRGITVTVFDGRKIKRVLSVKFLFEKVRFYTAWRIPVKTGTNTP